MPMRKDWMWLDLDPNHIKKIKEAILLAWAQPLPQPLLEPGYPLSPGTGTAATSGWIRIKSESDQIKSISQKNKYTESLALPGGHLINGAPWLPWWPGFCGWPRSFLLVKEFPFLGWDSMPFGQKAFPLMKM